MITDIDFQQFHRLGCSLQVNYFKIHIIDDLKNSSKKIVKRFCFWSRRIVCETYLLYEKKATTFSSALGYKTKRFRRFLFC